jgi:predicted transcriptional regulator of viral defense system
MIIGIHPIIAFNSDIMTFKEAVLEYAEEPLPRQIMMDLLKEYKRPNDKINELVKKGELTTVKKGLYVAGPRISITKPEPFLVANHLRGPSYLSLDAALSYWGLIPERVYEISSMTTKTSKSYKTPLGRFRYFHAPLPYYSFGIKSVELTARQVVLIASPEKALCDKIITTSGILLRSSRQVLEYLIDDLRIDEEMLRKLDTGAISTWIKDAPKKRSLSMLVNTIAGL